MLEFRIVVLATLGISAYGSHSILMVRHDFLRTGRLSSFTNGVLWISYTGYVGVILYTARNGHWVLPNTIVGTTPAGIVLILTGAVITAMGIRGAGVLYDVLGRTADVLIRAGVYRWSRNPQFVGWVLSLIGLGVVTRSSLALLQVGLFAAMLHGYVVYVKEPYMRQTCGNRFTSYRDETPRYIGLPVWSDR
jgi:protein-S-isoprenylcysteine O-methyltransferase Ste14